MAVTRYSARAHVEGPNPGWSWCGLLLNKRGRVALAGAFSWEDPRVCGSCYRRAEEAQIRDARRAEQGALASLERIQRIRRGDH
jgi:hypothetical protein